MRKEKFWQCTLRRSNEAGGIVEMVEWLQKSLAEVGREVSCAGQQWSVIHVGQESDDPRSAHECKT